MSRTSGSQQAHSLLCWTVLEVVKTPLERSASRLVLLISRRPATTTISRHLCSVSLDSYSSYPFHKQQRGEVLYVSLTGRNTATVRQREYLFLRRQPELKYIDSDPKVDLTLLELDDSSDRVFEHCVLAKLLCPRSFLDELNEDY